MPTHGELRSVNIVLSYGVENFGMPVVCAFRDAAVAKRRVALFR